MTVPFLVKNSKKATMMYFDASLVSLVSLLVLNVTEVGVSTSGSFSYLNSNSASAFHQNGTVFCQCC